MNFGFFTFVWQQVAVQIQGATNDLITALMGWVGPQFTYSATAYMVIRLLMACYSSASDAWQVFFRQLYLAAIIFTIITTTAMFNFWVVGLVQGLITGIGTAIGGVFGHPGAVTATSFDHMAIKVFAFGGQFFEHVGWTSPKSWILAGLTPLYWGFALGGIFIIFIVFLASSVVTNFFLSFGPLFIGLYFFPFTRKFFEGWVAVVAAGMLTQIFTIGWLEVFVASLGNMMTTIQNQQTGNLSNDVATDVLTLILSGLLITIFSAMTSLSAYAAMRISGGIYAQIARTPDLTLELPPHAPAPVGNTQQAALPPPGGNGSGLPSGNGGGAGGGTLGSGGPSTPQSRSYAFNHSVGSAE